jgi:hypothetical protein
MDEYDSLVKWSYLYLTRFCFQAVIKVAYRELGLKCFFPGINLDLHKLRKHYDSQFSKPVEMLESCGDYRNRVHRPVAD